ncbi:hypothetical protein MHH85_16925 [Viridibacillus sp. FSL E2-0187]
MSKTSKGKSVTLPVKQLVKKLEFYTSLQPIIIITNMKVIEQL